MFYPKAVLKNFAIFYRKTLVMESLFIKKRLQHRCFPVNIAKFSRTHILKKMLMYEAIRFLQAPAPGPIMRLPALSPPAPGPHVLLTFIVFLQN